MDKADVFALLGRKQSLEFERELLLADGRENVNIGQMIELEHQLEDINHELDGTV